MNKTILQVPVSTDLKERAEEAARKQGFSSLQEFIRVFLARLATNRLEITIQETVKLSESSERRYLKQTLDFEKNENIRSAKTVDELMNQLNENKIS